MQIGEWHMSLVLYINPKYQFDILEKAKNLVLVYAVISMVYVQKGS